MSAAATSKAFRARLQLHDHELLALQNWAMSNCALHSLFRSGGATVLVALRAAPQTSSSFARTLRGALRRRGFCTTGLRGRWLFLISEREAISSCVGTATELLLEAPAPAREEESRTLARLESPSAQDTDDRVVQLFR